MEYTNMSTIKDNTIKMGLDNKICENAIYFCKSHLVYLSEEDVIRKHCMQKLTPDMISYEKCKWLLKADDYEKEKSQYKEDIRKVNRSRAKASV